MMKTLHSETIEDSQPQAEEIGAAKPLAVATPIAVASAATSEPLSHTNRSGQRQYVKSIPASATSHQLSKVAREIHDHLQRDLDELLARHPEYQILASYAARLQEAIHHFNFVYTARARKSTQNTRPIGGQPYELDKNLSKYKREIYQRRRSQMRRLRAQIRWHLSDPDQDEFPEDVENADLKAAEVLRDLVIKRIKDFESGSYDESDVEFKHLFVSIDDNAQAHAALQQLKLERVYANLKKHNQAIDDIDEQQSEYEAQMARLPRMAEVERELRRVLRAIFTFMNFDLEAGRDTFKPAMAQFTAMVARTGTLVKTRETLKEASKSVAQTDTKKDRAKKENTKQANMNKTNASKPGETNTSSLMRPQAADARTDQSPHTSHVSRISHISHAPEASQVSHTSHASQVSNQNSPNGLSHAPHLQKCGTGHSQLLERTKDQAKWVKWEQKAIEQFLKKMEESPA